MAGATFPRSVVTPQFLLFPPHAIRLIPPGIWGCRDSMTVMFSALWQHGGIINTAQLELWQALQQWGNGNEIK